MAYSGSIASVHVGIRRSFVFLFGGWFTRGLGCARHRRDIPPLARLPSRRLRRLRSVRLLGSARGFRWDRRHLGARRPIHLRVEVDEVRKTVFVISQQRWVLEKALLWRLWFRRSFCGLKARLSLHQDVRSSGRILVRILAEMFGKLDDEPYKASIGLSS